VRTLKLTIEYDGAGYCGWQRQAGSAAPGAPSVQAALEAAVRSVAGEPAEVVGAGRTDAGVHACGQVASLVTWSRIPTDRFPAALNSRLPPDIRVLQAEDVPEGFHARRHAVARTYRYEILNRRAPSALLRGRAYHVPESLDVRAMQEALEPLLGRHDFTAYHGAGSEPRTTICTITGAAWERRGHRVRLMITADRFLRHMVRIIVGTCIRVGAGRLPTDAPAGFLSDPDNRRTGPAVPPQGLYLVRVDYGEETGPRCPACGSPMYALGCRMVCPNCGYGEGCEE
jgi:tRNA pseudouridine38-40 synthase